MSTDVANDEKLDFNGSCHCGAIKFKAENVSPNKATKCNCSICNITGTISLVVGEGTLKLILEDGKEEVLTYKNSRDGQNPALATYSFSPPDNKTYEVYHHFCSKCGVHVFLTGFAEFMGGSFNCVNLRTLNFKEHGRDMRDYTAPGKITYCDGLANTWAQAKEQFPGGAW